MVPSADPAGISPVAALARAHDPDRFLTALFAPPARREAVFTLIAFNHEIARALDIAAGSSGDYGGMGGHLRLQWWREVVRGDSKRHEVATPLNALLRSGPLEPSLLEEIIDARAAELDGLPDIATWQDGLRAGAGNLARAIAIVLDAPNETLDAITDAGAAYAVGKILRHLPTLDALGRRPLPPDVDRADIIATGLRYLSGATAVRLARACRAAILPAALARRDLARAAADGTQDRPRGIGDRLAVTACYLTGRL